MDAVQEAVVQHAEGRVHEPDKQRGLAVVVGARGRNTRQLGHASTDAAADGSFSFTGLRDGYYQLALLSPEGMGVPQLARVVVRGDPGVFQLTPTGRSKNVGTVALVF